MDFRNRIGPILALWGVLGAAWAQDDAQADQEDPVPEYVTPGSGVPPFAWKPAQDKEVRRFQNDWRRALLDFRAGRHLAAARHLRKLDPPEKLAQVYRTSLFARASLSAGKKAEADSALDATLRWVRGGRWQRHFFAMRLEAFDFESASPDRLKALADQSLQVPADSKDRADLLYRVLRLDSASLPAPERLSLTRQLLRHAPADARLEAAYRGWAASYPPGRGDWEIQKLLLDWEGQLGHVQKALDRGRAMIPLAPGKAEKKSLHWNYAGLWFRKGAYPEALKSYTLFQERYGESPDLFLQMARVYRNLESPGKTLHWYGQVVDRFPRHHKSGEILWMWAFEAEMELREEALDLYARIAAQFPSGKRGEWASFRTGLFYYKRGDFSAALELFRNPRNAGPNSAPRQAALFWEAKTLEALGDKAGARAARIGLCARFPWGFYGHLARFELESRREFPDSLVFSRRLGSDKAPEVKSWLKANAPGFRDTLALAGESAWLPVELLLEWNLDTLAMHTLRSLPASDLRSPWAMYVYSGQCIRAGMWRDAFLLGSRLADILPLEQWPRAPRSVLRRFYPQAFREVVGPLAAERNLPPELVYALAKQESGFDPSALSRAGARGLMQMIPSTGAAQAKREGLADFAPESLFEPQICVRLGTAFLRDVVARHDGNLYYALAHYNAGPKALGSWMPRLQGRLPEEAVEDLDFAETREYVKRVLANYWTYQALYDG